MVIVHCLTSCMLSVVCVRREQDKFIQFALDMHQTHTSLEVMQKMERWIIEHRKDPRASRLRRMVPKIGSFFVPLK